MDELIYRAHQSELEVYLIFSAKTDSVIYLWEDIQISGMATMNN